MPLAEDQDLEGVSLGPRFIETACVVAEPREDVLCSKRVGLLERAVQALDEVGVARFT